MRQRVAELEQNNDIHPRNVLYAIDDFVFILDQDNRFVSAYSSTEALYLPPEEFLGKTHTEVMPAQVDDLFTATVSKIKHGKSAEYEYQLEESDGLHWYATKLSPLMEGEQYTGLVAVVRDITERKKAEKEIQHSRNQLKSVFRAAPTGIGVVIDRKIRFANDRFCEMLGYTEEELVGQLSRIVYPSDDEFERVGKYKYEEIQEKGTGTIETLLQKKDGTLIDVLLSSTPLDLQDLSQGVTFTALDITERKQGQNALKESEEKYHSLYDNAPLSYQSLDIDGCFIDINPAWLKTLGYKREEVLGQCFEDFLHPNWQPHFRKNFPEFKKRGSISNVQFRIRHKEGHYLDISFDGCIGYTPEGKFKQTYCVFQDITEQLRVEKALSKSKVFNQTLLDTSPDIIYIYDILEQKNIYSNTRIMDILGYTSEEVQAMGEKLLPDLMAPDDFETYQNEIFPRYLKAKDGEIIKHKYRMKHKDGRWRWLFSKETIFARKDDGTPKEIFGLTADITEQVEVEEKANQISEKLVESEDRLSKVMLAANDGTWDWDLTTNEVYFDPRYYEMAGYEVDEFPHRLEEFQKRVHPDDIDYLMDEAQKHLGGEKERFIVEFRFKKKNNDWLWVMGRGIVVERDQQGIPLRFVGTHTDITERIEAENKLRESETKFRLLADYTFDWEYWIDPKGNYIYISPSCERITGYSAEEFKARPELFFDIVDPEYVKEIHAHYHDENNREHPSTMLEFPIINQDGQKIWLAHHCSPIFDEQGRYLGRRGNNRDITVRKKAEDSLMEALQLNESIVSSSPIGISIYDSEGNCVAANDAAADVIGATKAQVLQQNYHQLTSWKESGIYETALLSMQENARKYITVQIKTTFEKDCVLDIHFSPVPIGEERYLLAMFSDITERVQAEGQMKLQAHALESAANAIMITDTEGNIQWVNSAFQTLTGYSAEEALGQNPRVLKSEKHDERFYENMWATICAGEVWSGEIVNKRKDGTLYTEEMTIAPLLSEGGEISKFVAIKQDITERKETEKSARQYLERLRALRKIDDVISSSLDLDVTLHVLLDYSLVQLEVDAATVLLYEKSLQELTFFQAAGFRTKALEKTILQLGDGYAGKVALKREDLYIPDLQKVESSLSKAPLLVEEGFRTYYGVPLIARGSLVGVLEIFNRSSLEPNDEWVSYLHTLAGQAAIAIDNISLFNDLQRSNTNLLQAYNATIEGWAQALELRDMETEGHSRRVVKITMALAKRQGFKGQELVNIQRGALLHDIGKMGVPDSILQKTGKLSPEEWEVMKLHPVYAFEWLSSIEYLRPALDIPHYHHEKWDGSGYPHGLKGEQIPIAARIFAIVDVWDALLSDRPYRKAWSKEKTLTYIQEESGKHFDPEIVTLFLKYVSEK